MTRKLAKARRGNIVVLTAVLLVVLIGCIAFAVDIGYICLVRAESQNAADAAAMAGASRLPAGPAEARLAARTFAQANRADGSQVVVPDGNIVLGTWDFKSATFAPLAGAGEAQANAVQVACARLNSDNNSVALFFGPVLGTQTADVSASATACRISPRCGLIVGISKVTMSAMSFTDSYDAEAGDYQSGQGGMGGHVCSNGNITMSGSATIHGDAHPGPGGEVKTSGSASVLGEEEALKTAMVFSPTDPGDADQNNDNASIPNSDGGQAPLNTQGEYSLSGGDASDLPPGTYYFSKLALSGGSAIRISGPTVIYVTGDVSLSGGSVTNATSLPKNLQLFPMGSKCSISGSSAFHGVVYAPNTKVERSGSSDYYGSIIGGELVLSGSGGIHADESLDLSYLKSGPPRVVLVQ